MSRFSDESAFSFDSVEDSLSGQLTKFMTESKKKFQKNCGLGIDKRGKVWYNKAVLKETDAEVAELADAHV